MVRNITFSLPPELIRRAKILAAQRDLSLNALVHQTLESAVDAQDRSLQAGNRLLRKSQVGLYDIPPRSWKRSDFYE